MKNEEFSYIEIIWVFFIIILGLYAFYYYKNNHDKVNYPTYQQTPTHREVDSKKIKNSDSKNVNVKLATPPKLTNLYNEENQVIHSKNDIDIINKSNMLLYKDEFESSNPTFESELINTNMTGEFTPDLEKVYTQDLVENDDNTHDYNEIYDYCVKPNKSDLPIANIPLYALKDSSCSLKLSDSFNINSKPSKEIV